MLCLRAIVNQATIVMVPNANLVLLNAKIASHFLISVPNAGLRPLIPSPDVYRILAQPVSPGSS